MCLFPFAAPRPTKRPSRGPKKSPQVGGQPEVREVIYTHYPFMAPHPAATPINLPSNPSYMGYGFERWAEEHQPMNLTKGQWKEHAETTKLILDGVKGNSAKIDSAKETVSDEVKEAQKAAQDAHSSVRNVHAAVKNAQEAIQNNHKEIKSTQKVMDDHHSEHNKKQDDCAVEVEKIRKMLEEEAKKGEESSQKQLNMADLWSYLQWFQQSEQLRNGSSSSTQTSSTASSGSPRRRAHPERSHRRAFAEGYSMGREDNEGFRPFASGSPPWPGPSRTEFDDSRWFNPPPYREDLNMSNRGRRSQQPSTRGSHAYGGRARAPARRGHGQQLR
ncbi:hypothetical protein F5Y15DRAFT_361958 [Xylariaceae sp. FL0016]|nr:hypothetical protein F5Y15DRAFT_361958 [Xylariaceae sp. FL0016]